MSSASAFCIYNTTNKPDESYRVTLGVTASRQVKSIFGVETKETILGGSVASGDRICTRGQGGQFVISFQNNEGNSTQMGSPRKCSGTISDHGYIIVRTEKGDHYPCAGGLACPEGMTYKGMNIVCEVHD